MLLSLAHLLAYTLVQTFGISIFTLSLKRIGKLSRSYRVKAFLFLLMVNLSGTLTFGEFNWQNASRPIAAGLFLIGMAFFFLCHAFLAWRYLKKRK